MRPSPINTGRNCPHAGVKAGSYVVDWTGKMLVGVAVAWLVLHVGIRG